MATDVTNIELFEALTPSVGPDAARMIAEVVPLGEDVATKSSVRDEIAGSEKRLERRFDQRFDHLERWAIFLLGPIWAGGIAAIVRTLFFG